MRPLGYVVHVKTPGTSGGETRSYQVAQALGASGTDIHLYGDVNSSFEWNNRVHPHSLKHPTPIGAAQLISEFSHYNIGVAIERYHFPPFNVGFLAQQVRKKPIIFEVHGFPIDELALMSHQPDVRLGRLTKLVARLPRVIWEQMQAALFRRVAHFIVTSAGTKEILMSLGVLRDQISVIYNCVDPTLFDASGRDPLTCRTALNLPRDGKIVLYAGSLSPEMLSTLVEAVALVIAAQPSMHFVYARLGPTTALEELAHAYGLSHHQFLPMQPIAHRRMPDLLTASDVVLAPYHLNSARFRMGFHYSPLKVMEALAMAKPVVTVDAAELRTMFGALPNAHFAESGCAQSWAAGILSALDSCGDPALQQGRAFVMSGYRWQDAAQKYLDIIRSVEEHTC